MKAERGQPEIEADGEPVVAVGVATAPAELVAVELAGTLPLLPVPQPLLSVPAPETGVVEELAAPPVVAEPEEPEEPARSEVPAELVAVELAVTLPLLPVPQPLLSVPAPETDVVEEIAAPPAVEADGPAALAVPAAAELVAVELAVALPLLPVPQPALFAPTSENDVVEEIAAPVVAEIAAPMVVEPVVSAESVVAAPPPPPEPAPPAALEFFDQDERIGWLRRVRSLIALIFLAALLGATLAAIVIGIGVLIALAAQHAIG